MAKRVGEGGVRRQGARKRTPRQSRNGGFADVQRSDFPADVSEAACGSRHASGRSRRQRDAACGCGGRGSSRRDRRGRSPTRTELRRSGDSWHRPPAHREHEGRGSGGRAAGASATLKLPRPAPACAAKAPLRQRSAEAVSRPEGARRPTRRRPDNRRASRAAPEDQGSSGDFRPRQVGQPTASVAAPWKSPRSQVGAPPGSGRRSRRAPTRRPVWRGRASADRPRNRNPQVCAIASLDARGTVAARAKSRA